MVLEMTFNNYLLTCKFPVIGVVDLTLAKSFSIRCKPHFERSRYTRPQGLCTFHFVPLTKSTDQILCDLREVFLAILEAVCMDNKMFFRDLFHGGKRCEFCTYQTNVTFGSIFFAYKNIICTVLFIIVRRFACL